MSKLIVEMEMPIGCTWTDENENGHHCPLLDIDCDCVLQEKGRKIGWDEQYANCPIKGELVLCGKCYYKDEKRIMDEDALWCRKHHMYVTADWFCADGERRTDE